ncbi:exo-alpha-sialidase [soil metagenome]
MPNLLISTKKGLFPVTGTASGWSVGTPSFLGENVTLAMCDPRDGTWYAAMNLGHFGVKLKASKDQGKTWFECGVPAYAEGETYATHDENVKGIAKLKLIWALEPGHASQPGRLWCGTLPGGLFKSDDLGVTWNLVESLWRVPERKFWFGGGADQPGIHSICIDPRDPKIIRVAISCGGVWTSIDDGATWALEGQGLRADFLPPDQQYSPVSQDAHIMVQCPAEPDRLWIQHHNGIFVSSDAAKTFTELPHATPSVFGFTVAVHPQQGDTAWFVPGVKDECRVPVKGQFVVSRTTDGGKTFETITKGLPQQPAYDIVYRHALAIDHTGKTLAMGSTTGGLWTSDDSGDSWSLNEVRLPPVHAVRFIA